MTDDAMRADLFLWPVRRLLGVALALLFAGGLWAEVMLNVAGEPEMRGLVPLLNLSFEANLPTWYSAALLLTASLLLGLIGAAKRRAGDRFARHWLGLAAAFLYISADEAAVIHESLNGMLRDAFAFDGVLYFGWVVPAGLLLLVLAAVYARFLRALPRRFAVLFVAAGAVYVGGALGTELAISLWYAGHGGSNITYGLLNLVQETLEIAGVSLFVWSLLAYLGEAIGGLTLTVARR